MSIEYTLYNKPLSRTELLEQTDLTIKIYPSRDNNSTIDIIYDNDGGWVRIKSFEGDNIYELETGNKWDYIMDTIVGKFDNVEYFNIGWVSYNSFPKDYDYDTATPSTNLELLITSPYVK